MSIITWLNDNIIWDMPMLILMIGTGVYLTFITNGVIFKKFGTVMKHTLRTIFKRYDYQEKGTITPFQAVSTALAATVGTGNIVGVAVAIQAGGPGAIFWMWISALIGMVTKYAEVTLAVAYRGRNDRNEIVGGPMYYITRGMGSKTLACLFCIFGFLASYGIGNMVQANSLAGGLESVFSIPTWITGIVLAILVGLVIIGGIGRIASVAEILVPLMAVLYMLGAAMALIANASNIPAAFISIIRDAFTGTAAVGGFAGATSMYATRIGISRGIFTNEAGLGSAPIAHAAAHTDHPARQGLWGAFEVFFDTLVMCTVTALVILSSGLWTDSSLDGNTISSLAFENAFKGGSYIVSIGLVLFAFATIIAWYYYAEKCVEFLFGRKGIIPFRISFTGVAFVGCVSELELVWQLADLLNGMMAIPNLIALIALSGVVRRLTKDFFKDPDRKRPRNENFSKYITIKRK